MARASVASASTRSDSIKGLAQSIAKPAYRRLLTAEPLLRRAVPVLIVAFLITICVGAAVQMLDQRRQTLANHAATLEAAADLVAEHLQQRGRADARAQDALNASLPSWGNESGRLYLLTNIDGIVSATSPSLAGALGRNLIDLLGPIQPLTTFGASAGVLDLTLPDDTRALPRRALAPAGGRKRERSPSGARSAR